MDTDEYRSIISNAIEREIESYTFYRTVREKVTDENLKNLFNELAGGEESKHRKTLEALLLKEPGKLGGFDTKRDYKVADTLDVPPLSADLKPLDGLVIAIRKELDAMQMYTQLAGLSVDPDQIELFESLASMERGGHKARLEDIYTNRAFPEAW
ncbi:ferritin [Methanoculleus chikugoensis]|uniref:ferritin-like domain-containing protein n=1 Tax=Methanoculleus chikugoensis TaxID=118126 RepID=UPI0006D12123|nr:ferritin family protein [Methanoculleus chikugoensis]